MEVSKCDAYLQERLEGESRELQGCQPNLTSGEGYGAAHLEWNQKACAGQPGAQGQTVRGLIKAKSCLTEKAN